MRQERKLYEIATIAAGQGAPQGEENYCNDGIPFIKAGNLAELLNGKKETDVQKVNEQVANRYKLKLYPKGTILFAKSGMSCMKGYVYQLQSSCYVVSHLACVTAHGIIGKYLKYYFEFHKPNSLVKDEAYPSISLADIGEMSISYGDKDEQLEVVGNLDKISNIIYQRRQELKKIDDLVKSQFIEQFGTIDNNFNNFPIIKLEDLCEKITDGKHGGCSFEDNSSFYFVGAREIYDDEVHFCDAPQIPESEFLKDYKRCDLQNGDLVIVNTGATIGKSALIDSSLASHTLLQKSVALIRTKKTILSPHFLKHCYRANPKMYRVINASAQPNLLLSRIKATTIIVPPMEQQNEFVAFAKQSDKSKIPYETEVAA